MLFIWGFFPPLLIFFQIPIQIDLVDGGHDCVAEKILCIGLCLAEALSCGSYFHLDIMALTLVSVRFYVQLRVSNA